MAPDQSHINTLISTCIWFYIVSFIQALSDIHICITT